MRASRSIVGNKRPPRRVKFILIINEIIHTYSLFLLIPGLTNTILNIGSFRQVQEQIHGLIVVLPNLLNMRGNLMILRRERPTKDGPYILRLRARGTFFLIRVYSFSSTGVSIRIRRWPPDM